jgi:methionyl-tRNA formyltransferase
MMLHMPHSIIFCGTPDFAVPVLEALAADAEFDVKLIVTQPDRPAGRSKKVMPSPVKEAATRLGFPLLQPENINDPLIVDQLSLVGCDFLIVVAYGQILAQTILDLPKIAPINIHGSLLPRWRGASPIEHAILSGDTETGVTAQIMVLELDAGPILSSATIPLTPADTALELRKKLSVIGAGLLIDTLKKPLDPKPQTSEGATFCRKLTKEDGHADREKMTAEEIDRRVRALNPWPGVTCDVMGHPLKLLETSLEQAPRSIPVSCMNDTTLYVVKVKAAGKKEMFADDWRRGLRA